MFGFVKSPEKNEDLAYDIKKDRKRRMLIIYIILGVIGIGILNLILFLLSMQSL